MISVAVRGYGIVVWEEGGEWRTFAPSVAMSAILAARVEAALRRVPEDPTRATVCAALLSIHGAQLFAIDCDHEPGECEGEAGPH